MTIPDTSRKTSRTEAIPDDIERIHIVMVNAFLVGAPGSGDWALVDAGLPLSGPMIIAAAERRFGPGARPRAIILTHGHFDHRGAIDALLERWPDVPVYAHELELPYLTGRSNYPPPDPTVGGGAVARFSPLYPRRPIDLGNRVHRLPADGSVPGMPGWQWVFTPGHSPGHVALFRPSDRALLPGDAFCTQKQESLLGVLTEFPVMEGPPAYFTMDWDAARVSVGVLAELKPAYAAPSHGLPVAGQRLQTQLETLARDFNRLALPAHGRYVHAPRPRRPVRDPQRPAAG